MKMGSQILERVKERERKAFIKSGKGTGKERLPEIFGK